VRETQKWLAPNGLLLVACASVVSNGAAYACGPVGTGHLTTWGHLAVYWLSPILWVAAILVWQVGRPRIGLGVVLVGSIFLVLSYVFALFEVAGKCIS
jgi:hypothetical protein